MTCDIIVMDVPGYESDIYFKDGRTGDANYRNNARNQKKKRTCRLAMASLSLKQRFLLIALPVLILSVGVVIYSAALVQQTTRQSIRAIDKSRQIDWQIRLIKETLQDLEIYIHQYTLISYSFDPETRKKIELGNNRLSTLVGILQRHISLKDGDNLHYTQLTGQLARQVKKLNEHIQRYQTMILEPNVRFPGMWLMEQKLLPANIRFIQLLEPAITELENEVSNENTHRVINLLKDLRYVWVQQISWFRLFIANRSGIFGSPEISMKQNLENRQLYVDQVEAYLNELQTLDRENRLGLEVSSSLPVLIESFNNYKKYYRQIREIYTSDDWRIDIAYLTSTIRPDFNRAREIIDKINRLQKTSTDNNIQHSYAVAKKISMMNWLSVAGIFLFILVGYIIFEYLIRRPVLNIAHALNAEAAGASYTPVQTFRLAETRLLLDAFQNMQQQVRHRQIRLEAVLDNAAEGIVTYDEHGHIEAFNHAAEKLFGYSLKEIRGKPVTLLLARVNINHLRAHKRGALLNLDEEMHARRKDQTTFCMSVKISSYLLAGQRMYTAIVADISERQAMIEDLQYIAQHDSLTGLHNRSYFMQELEHVVERVDRSENRTLSCALLYIDLDNFKYVNDTLGHIAGDQLLVEITRILQHRLRHSDLLARIGGDEFALLLYDVTDESAVHVAESFRQQVQDYTFRYQQQIVDIGCSIGVTMIEAHTGKENLLARADFSCHAAKLAGRNQVHVYCAADEKFMGELFDDMGWTRRIKLALEHDMFIIACQPIVEPSGQIASHEVLLRMAGRHNNVIMPSGFIPPAERFGLMAEIDKWVIRHALRMLREIQDNNQDRKLSINLSAVSFESADIIQVITDEIERNGIDSTLLIFEITETVAMSNLSLAAGFLSRLQALGCKTALDDFGAGYSSYAYLKDLPVDFVKIDGSFIKNIESDPLNREIVQSMHNIAHLMGKKTIAEFVETRQAMDILGEIGIDLLQGFHIGRPSIPPSEQARLAQVASF